MDLTCLRKLQELRRTGLPADRLELEVTETLLTNTKQALAILQRLRAQGIHITLDDFGTGYASLNHLRSFPFEKLKIDQSFVQHSRGGSQGVIAREDDIGVGGKPRPHGCRRGGRDRSAA